MYQVNVGIKALFGSLVWKNTCTAFYKALAVFSKFSFSGILLPWWTVLLCWVNKTRELGKGLVRSSKKPPWRRDKTGIPRCSLFLPACELFYTCKSKEQDVPSHQMEGSQHLAVTGIDKSSHTSKWMVIPFCPSSFSDFLPELHSSGCFLLRTIRMSTHWSCSPQRISGICSFPDGDNHFSRSVRTQTMPHDPKMCLFNWFSKIFTTCLCSTHCLNPRQSRNTS